MFIKTKEIIVPIIQYSWGLGDEIHYLNKLIDYKLKFYFDYDVIFYEFFCPIMFSPHGFNSLNQNFLDSDFFKKNKEKYYQKKITDSDIDENFYSGDNNSKIQNFHIFKSVSSRINVNKKFRTKFVLLNLFDPDNWEAIYIKGAGYKTFTKHNCIEKNVNKKIIDSIELMNNYFLSNLCFNNIFKIYINFLKNNKEDFNIYDRRMLEDPNFLECKSRNTAFLQAETNRNFLTFIETGHISHNQVLIDASQQFNQHYITKKNNNNETVNVKELYNMFNQDYLHNILIKGLYYNDISIVKENITTELIKQVVCRYNKDEKISRMSLNEMFTRISQSKLVIGGEGGHMHIALYSGIPYLFVIPNQMLYHGDFKYLEFATYKNALLNFMFFFLIDRYPLNNLFFTTEEDITNHTQKVIEDTLYLVDLKTLVEYTKSKDIFTDNIISYNSKIKRNLIKIYKENYINFISNN